VRACPVPGAAAGAARPIITWRLDRDRLAALIAAAAPGIPIVDASTDPTRTFKTRANNEASRS
jgi:hypothetical protein